MTEPNQPSPLPRLPIQRFPTVDQLQRTVADAFCEAVSITLEQQDSFRVALSGGSTPKRLYELLAERELPWDQIHWFWGDERNVPDSHSESNAKMVRTALLDRVPAPAMNIHPVAVEPQNPALAAESYRKTLRSHFPDDTLPTWDLVLLGMGDDGHTASLFPHTDALSEQKLWFVENWVEKFGAYRYTLTASAINSGQRIWFLVAGENKRPALEEVLSGRGNERVYPSRLIQPTQWWVTDDALPL